MSKHQNSKSNWTKGFRWKGNSRGRWKQHTSSHGDRTYIHNIGGSQNYFHSQKDKNTLLSSTTCPYKGWPLYMQEGYKEDLEVVRIVRIFEDYLRIYPSIVKGIEEKQSFSINMKDILGDEDIKKKLPDLPQIIHNEPEKLINMLGLAAHQIVWKNLVTSMTEEARAVLSSHSTVLNKDEVEKIIPDAPLPVIHARLNNVVQCTPLKNLKASYYGKLVSIKGTVVRVGSIKPFCKQMAFACCKCGSVQTVIQPEGRYAVPSSCPQDQCHSRTFLPNRAHTHTHTVDCQGVRLQEISNDDQREGGRVPRTVDCEVKEDLVDSCIPGDIVTVTGIVKVLIHIK